MAATFGIATRSHPAETANGDRAVTLVRSNAIVLGVIDGLGHGTQAEQAALRAVEALERASTGDVSELFAHVDAALRGTRGAAMTLAVIRGRTCEAAGVGNVALRAQGVRGLSLAQTPGIVGAQRRSLRTTRGELGARARIAIWSDGITSRLSLDEVASLSPEDAARAVLDRHAADHDDATIVIADL
jgi:hypothetical protein